MPQGDKTAKRVLVVEDSMIIALDAEECLLSLGAGEVSVQATVADALAALGGGDFDFALLDFNLGSESSEAVAEELRKQGTPFWLATGYGEMADKVAELGAQGVLVKPYGRQEMVALMEKFAALGGD